MYCSNYNSFSPNKISQGINVQLESFALSERGVSLVRPTVGQSGLFVAHVVT